MTLFDGYLMVDWSAASAPKTGTDSIWIAFLARGVLILENPATRAAAEERIAELTEGFDGRVLAGFDFPFGYPEGTAQELTGVDDWRVLWSFLEQVVQEGPDNSNNRFTVAADLNARFDGKGPFWGYPHQHHGRYPGLPFKCPDGYGVVYPARKREAEQAVAGTQEVWKLVGNGSVGSQVLMGIPVLERLRHRLDATVWPFEVPGDGTVIAEIFPSAKDGVGLSSQESVKDAAQVRGLVEGLARIDADGKLGAFLDARADMSEAVLREEACILGMGVKGGLAAALNGQGASHPPTPAPRPSNATAREMRYERDPAAIYRQSFETVQKEARLERFPSEMRPLVVRLIHACGMVEVADRLAFSDAAVEVGRQALLAGKPVFCDCEMVRSGIIARHLPAQNELICTLNEEPVRGLASEIGNTRSAAAVELWGERLEGAVVAIGNAPTALFHLLELMAAGGARPALILGFPVGFVGAAESKAELAARPLGAEFIALRGRRGGSAMASAAVNALAAGLEGGL